MATTQKYTVDQLRGMSKEDLLPKLADIVEEQLGCNKEEVVLGASLVDDLGADSLDIVELLMAVEESFGGIDIPDEDALKMQTVGDVLDYLHNKINPK